MSKNDGYPEGEPRYNCDTCAKSKDGYPVPELCTHTKRSGLVQCRGWKKKTNGYNLTNSQVQPKGVTLSSCGQLIIDDYCSFGYETLEKGIYLMKKETESISVNSA